MGSIVGIVIALGLGYWVYQDANKNKMDNAVVYAIVTGLIWIVGLPIYLWKRSQHLKAISGGGGQGQLPG
jgi:hypothetical protein